MPIRKDLRRFYTGPGWSETRERIMARARGRCELCKVKNHALIERGPDGVWRLYDAPCGTSWRNSKGNITTFEPIIEARRKTRVVLTVAHLNHTPGDDRPENLKALCQWCHLNYDKLHHRDTRCNRKDAARPLLKGGTPC